MKEKTVEKILSDIEIAIEGFTVVLTLIKEERYGKVAEDRIESLEHMVHSLVALRLLSEFFTNEEALGYTKKFLTLFVKDSEFFVAPVFSSQAIFFSTIEHYTTHIHECYPRLPRGDNV